MIAPILMRKFGICSLAHRSARARRLSPAGLRPGGSNFDRLPRGCTYSQIGLKNSVITQNLPDQCFGC